MARTSADITIHRIDGTTLPVPITPEARRTWRLGSEDSVRLRWDSNTEYRAKVGDWIDDNVNDGGYGFGKFYVTAEQEPTFDTSTGAFRHDIRFDRDYIGWRNVLHMLTYNTGGNTYERKETEWSLTDSLENHLSEIVRGLKVVGYSCANPVVESTVENPEVAVSMSFSGTSVYDALNALAEAYSCEWWVTYNSSYTTSTIHFGKYESGNAFDITLGDNAEDVTPTENGGVRANRIFAFGSTRNISETYRKTLTFSVTDTSTRTYDGQTATVFRDSHRVITKDMLKSDEATSKGVNLSLGSFIYGDSTTDPQYRESATAVSAFTLTDAVRYGLDGELSVMAKFTRNDDTEEDGEWSWLLSIDGTEIATGGGDLTGHLVGDTTITVNISETISDSVYLTAGEHTARLEILTLNSHFYLQYAKATTATATLTPSGFKVTCPLLYNGVTYIVTFNPLSEPYSADTFNWFSFTGSVPSGFSVGKTYTLMLSDGETPGLLPLKIPMSFYSDDVGSITSLRMVGARRLMLPLSYPGYVQTGNPTDRKLVEKVVIFDNIYPKLYLQIYDMTVGTYTDNTEWSDGSRSYGSLPKFTFKVKRIKSNHTLDTFNFKRDYLTSDPLQAVFVTYDEAHNNGSTSTSSFLLSGMTFSLNFNEEAQTYTIAYNEDYGAKLPNSILKPENGDAFILTGWNVNAIQSLGIVDDAEEQLADAAEAYLEAVSKPTFTWRCRMMSDSMMSSGLLNPGRKVRITRGGLEDTTRVIGFEYKLDIPEDTPEYECGETEAYSRLRELEKALNAKTVNTTSASGGAVTSSSSSGSSSESGSLSAVLSWQAGTVDPATFDTFDGSEDKLINIPSEIDHLSDGDSVPRIDEVIETRTDGSKVVRLVDGSGNTVLPSGAMDWFIEETYTEDNTTKQRLKLNPRYQGMYAEGWVSAGGVSDTGGGVIVASLKDLTDVDDNLNPSSGQVLTYDGTKWTAGNGGQGSVTGITVGGVPYSPVSGIVALPAYPTTLPASDVYAWAKKSSLEAADVPSLPISKITGLQSALSGYLPLTGGTITGTTTLTYGTNLEFVDSNGENHSVRVLLTWPDSLAHYVPGNGWVRIWDSGNDGSGSGLDADLLDGKHAGDFVGVYVDGETSVGDFVTPGMYRINMNPGRPSNYANILVVRGASSDTLAQMGFDYYNNGYTYIRSGTLNDIASKSWERFALTSDNVASATKLQTARTIWGQDFDGTGNVDGLLTANLQAGAAGTAIQINDSISQGYSAIRFAVNGIYEATIQYLKNVNDNPLGQHVLSIDPVSSNTMPSSAFVSLGLWTNPALWVDCTNYRVGVGTTSPAYRLDVAGDVRASGKVYIGTSGGYLEVVNVGTTASPVYALKSTLPFFSDSWVSAGGVGTSGGGGGASYLDDLLDVTTTGVENGQALVYNNGVWSPHTIEAGDTNTQFVFTQSQTEPPAPTGIGGTSWTAVADVNWITLGKSSGNGSDTISYTVAANTGNAMRSGTITVTYQGGSKTLTVTQSGVYELVDYIMATGSQYINTGLYGDEGTTVTIDFTPTVLVSGAGRTVFGHYNSSSDSISVYLAPGGAYTRYDGVSVSWSWSTLTRYEVTLSPTGAQRTANGSTESVTWSASSFTTAGEMKLGYGGTGNYFYGRLYGCKIWDGSTLVMELVPAYDTVGGVYGMYDNVSNTFLTSATGTDFDGPS